MVVEISIYLLICIICGIALIVMAMFGFDDVGDMDFDIGGADVDIDAGHFDAGHGDFSGAGLSPLSLPLILSFGTSFGAFGAIFSSLEMNPYLVPILAGLVSIGISAVIFFLLVKLFIQTQATTQVKTHKLVGESAEVTVSVSPETNGQILIKTTERGRTLLTATSDQDIPKGSIVTITEVVGSTVVVKKKEGLVE
jgi:membrane protein implicated in regulation of membrane protease activity